MTACVNLCLSFPEFSVLHKNDGAEDFVQIGMLAMQAISGKEWIFSGAIL